MIIFIDLLCKEVYCSLGLLQYPLPSVFFLCLSPTSTVLCGVVTNSILLSPVDTVTGTALIIQSNTSWLFFLSVEYVLILKKNIYIYINVFLLWTDLLNPFSDQADIHKVGLQSLYLYVFYFVFLITNAHIYVKTYAIFLNSFLTGHLLSLIHI